MTGPDSPPSGPAEPGLTAEQVIERTVSEGPLQQWGHTHELAEMVAVQIVTALAESGYVIVPRPDGDEVTAVAQGLLDYEGGFAMDAEDKARALARTAISTLTAYREGQDG